MNIEFFQRRKSEIENAFSLKSKAIDTLDDLKYTPMYTASRISHDQYCAIRDYIEASAQILESDLRYVSEKIQPKPVEEQDGKSPRSASKCVSISDH